MQGTVEGDEADQRPGVSRHLIQAVHEILAGYGQVPWLHGAEWDIENEEVDSRLRWPQL